MTHFCLPTRPASALVLSFLVLLLCLPTAGQSATVPDGFADELVASGFDRPMSLRFLPDGRMLVAERLPANVLVLSADGSQVLATALTIPNVPDGGERGLLSIAVDPKWPSKPYLYAFFARDDGTNQLVLARYTATGDLDGTGDGVIDFTSSLDLLTDIPDNDNTHNGGDLRWDDTGALYLSIGDDQDKCAAQDLTSPLGKILRLEVDGIGDTAPVSRGDLVAPDNPFAGSSNVVKRLVWASGLRNPFRTHVDPQTGNLFVADVGWTEREEISHLVEGGSNLGWPYVEGNLEIATSYADCTMPAGFSPLDPIEDYTRSYGRTVISGGVYRTPNGATHPWPAEYDGDYFYADFFEGYLRRLEGSGQSWSVAEPVAGQVDPAFWATDLGSGRVAFEWGPDGSLYYLNLSSGELRRIVYQAATPTPASTVSLTIRAEPSTLRASTQLRFEGNLTAPSNLRIYDVAGRLVRTIPVSPGSRSVAWNARDDGGREVGAGVYLVRLRSGEREARTKLVKLP